MKHFLTLRDFTKEEILDIIRRGIEIKSELKSGIVKPYLKDKTLAMIFEKSSTRTRVSFEVGMFQLGGHALFLSNKDIQLGRGEPVIDTARVIASMCDMVMIRTFEHERLETFAKYSKVPVINGLTDSYHPVQMLADYMTMVEQNKGLGSTVAWVGDGNNVANSWLILAAKLGLKMHIATPKGYEVEAEVLSYAKVEAEKSGGYIETTHDPKKAVENVDVVITDTWASMGKEDEKSVRQDDFDGFIVDEALMALAKNNAIFLHCLPAYRGQEVSETVLEGPQSVVFQAAENRLHAQKGLMVWLNEQK